MPILRPAWLLPALLLGGPVEGVELVMRDAHLALEALPTDFDFTYSGTSSERSGEDAFDSGFGLVGGGRWSLNARGSRFAGVVALDAIVGQYVYDGDATNFSTGARIGAGLGCALDDRWTLLAGAHAEVGLATFDMPASEAAAAVRVDGSYVGWGLGIDGFFAASERLWLQAGVGWREQAFSLADGGRDLELETAGMTAAIGFCVRIGLAPRRLE